jgi:putative molybdopterin biosynthesis protein
MPHQIKNQISNVRAGRGLSVAELAKRIGVTRQTLYSIEAGTYVPNTEVALKMARELETSVEELFVLPKSGLDASAAMQTDYLSSSKPGKGQAVRVCRVGDKWVSIPVSPSPYYMPEADGVITETMRTTHGTKLAVFSKEEAGQKRLVIAGCDPATSLLARLVERLSGVEVVHAPASSRLALEWLKEGKVHIAGSHLEDPDTAEFNLPFVRRTFPRQEMSVLTFAEWEEGFLVARGNPKNIRSIHDLARKGVRFTNREAGSGSRGLLDKLLRKASLRPARISGYNRAAMGHLAAAHSIVIGDADCCIATRSAAQSYGLGFVPLRSERYDFVLHRETMDHPAVEAFCDVLQRSVVRRKLETLAGYDTSKTGVLLV